MECRVRSLATTYFLESIEFKPGDLVVDCGANVGDLKLFFRERELNIEYIGIEPSPKEFECLKENVAPSEALNIGLWDANGTIEFFVSSDNADSSLIRPAKFDEIVRVEVKRLDEILRRPIRLLKLEAEGAEPEVIRGAEGLLPTIDYIAADLGFERGTEEASTFVPVVNYLADHGFELIDVSHQRVTALFRNKRLRAAE